MGNLSISNNFGNTQRGNSGKLTSAKRASVPLSPEEIKVLAEEFKFFDKKAGETTAVERETSNLSFDVVGDEWRALASKKDLTPDDIKNLMKAIEWAC